MASTNNPPDGYFTWLEVYMDELDVKVARLQDSLIAVEDMNRALYDKHCLMEQEMEKLSELTYCLLPPLNVTQPISGNKSNAEKVFVEDEGIYVVNDHRPIEFDFKCKTCRTTSKVIVLE